MYVRYVVMYSDSSSGQTKFERFSYLEDAKEFMKKLKERSTLFVKVDKEI